jgi:hypothetical protein
MLRTLSRPLCRLSRTTYRPISTAVRDGGIFYHPLSPPNPLSPTRAAWAITFLSQPPIQPASKEVVGWLPAESETAEVDVGLEDFKENGRSIQRYVFHETVIQFESLLLDKFIDLLHSTIKESLIQNPEVDTELVNEAAQRGGGWMHIFGILLSFFTSN